MGYDPLTAKTEQYTVPSVIQELKTGTIRTRVETAIDLETLKVQQPTPQARAQIDSASTKLGDSTKLSHTDRDLLALCLDLNTNRTSCTLVSDDYTIQNVAEHLSIPHRTLTTHGIRYKFNWLLYCPACGKAYPPNHKEKDCAICGTLLKRKVSKKKRIKGQTSPAPQQPEPAHTRQFSERHQKPAQDTQQDPSTPSPPLRQDPYHDV